MLAKKYRLKNKKEFEKVYKNSKKIKNEFFLLKFQVNNLNNSRVGIVVPKKMKVTTVKRNKIKRLISEAIRSLWPQIKNGYDMIFICQKEVLDFWQIKKEIKRLLKKVNIYSN